MSSTRRRLQGYLQDISNAAILGAGGERDDCPIVDSPGLIFRLTIFHWDASGGVSCLQGASNTSVTSERKTFHIYIYPSDDVDIDNLPMLRSFCDSGSEKYTSRETWGIMQNVARDLSLLKSPFAPQRIFVGGMGGRELSFVQACPLPLAEGGLHVRLGDMYWIPRYGVMKVCGPIGFSIQNTMGVNSKN